jgi:hypothetical protein
LGWEHRNLALAAESRHLRHDWLGAAAESLNSAWRVL